MAMHTDNKPSNLEKGPSPQTDSDAPPGTGTKSEAPEGGITAWLCLLGAAAGMFVSFGWVNCIALFQAQYQTHQLREYSESTVSWITSMECK